MSGNSAIIPSRVLGVEPVTATLVCIPCQFGLVSLNAAAKHIRKHHGEHVDSLDEHVAAAGAALALAAAEGHDMRQLYLNAPQSTSGVDRQPLAPLAMLSVSNGFQCVWCDKCFKVLRNVREHGNVVHDGRGDELYKAMCQAGMIKVQTLLTGVKLSLIHI